VALRLRPAPAVEWIEVGVSGPILISTDRARERLGWRPRFDSAGALRKYVESVR
jgi:nucleoside-diphosphate-sugar epimerase